MNDDKMKFLIMFFVVISCFGCRTFDSKETLGKDTSIAKSSGMGSAEAILIAQVKIMKEGMEERFDVDVPVVENQPLSNVWTVRFKEKGYLADEWLRVYVDKQSGKVIYLSEGELE